MLEEGVHHQHDVDDVILLIILNGHFHLVLDNDKQEYQYYSSCQSLQYDKDVIAMVISYGNPLIGPLFSRKKELFDKGMEIELGEKATSTYPLIHDRDCLR